MKKERKEYEQKYLSRYKQPKSGKEKMLVLVYTNLKYQNQKNMKKRTQGIRTEISFTLQTTKDKEKCWF